jgi:hypothetical protein
VTFINSYSYTLISFSFLTTYTSDKLRVLQIVESLRTTEEVMSTCSPEEDGITCGGIIVRDTTRDCSYTALTVIQWIYYTLHVQSGTSVTSLILIIVGTETAALVVWVNFLSTY